MQFEPSKETKEYYLYTKKKPMTEGGFVHPGLFSSRYTLSYSLLFFIVLLLEVYGMFMLYSYGAFQPWFAILLVLLDIILAFGAHLFQKRIKELDIELALINDEIQYEKLRRKQIKPKLLKGFLLSLIALLAIGKMAFFFGFYQNFDALVLVIITTYALVAVIHINVTGYILFEYIRTGFNSIDYRKFIRDYSIQNRQEFQERKHSFSSNELIIACNINKHKIYKDTNSGQFIILTYGMFMDDDLKALVNQQQSPETKYKVAREGLYHQYYSILGSQPIFQ
ncbi:MAG: hypothetical protein H6570_21890 [Lewinellaceae bacterium]|nr:hypothetical protein [Lewinellaceae bacterium]